MVRNIKICPRNYLKTPTELVQNFITIEFAVVENPYTRTQNIKFPTREKVGLHGIQPSHDHVRTLVESLAPLLCHMKQK